MGYTSQHRERGQLDREFWQGELESRYRILDCATVNRSTFYAAVEDTEAGTVLGFVALQQWTPASYYNFTHKTMTEQAGPSAAECPARILDLLTELPPCYGRPHTEWACCGICNAREWREDCRKLADRRARAATVKPGQLVRFARPIEFGNGAKLNTLMFRSRDLFSEQDGYGRYRVTGWRTMAGWELVQA
jgi:hypothetical protein